MEKGGSQKGRGLGDQVSLVRERNNIKNREKGSRQVVPPSQEVKLNPGGQPDCETSPEVGVIVHKMVPGSPGLTKDVLPVAQGSGEILHICLFTLENHRDFDSGFSNFQQRGMHALAAFNN